MTATKIPHKKCQIQVVYIEHSRLYGSDPELGNLSTKIKSTPFQAPISFLLLHLPCSFLISGSNFMLRLLLDPFEILSFALRIGTDSSPSASPVLSLSTPSLFQFYLPLMLAGIVITLTRDNTSILLSCGLLWKTWGFPSPLHLVECHIGTVISVLMHIISFNVISFNALKKILFPQLLSIRSWLCWLRSSPSIFFQLPSI